jgi:hypothetical protein
VNSRVYIRIDSWKCEHVEHVWWLTPSVRCWQQIYPPIVNTCVLKKPQIDLLYISLYINVYVSVYKHTQITGHTHGNTAWQSYKYVPCIWKHAKYKSKFLQQFVMQPKAVKSLSRIKVLTCICLRSRLFGMNLVIVTAPHNTWRHVVEG